MNNVHLCECGCGQPTQVAEKNHTKNGYVKGQPFRFIRGHYLKLHPLETRNTFPPVAVRFWQNVQKTDTCWLWTGSVSGNGYGTIYADGKREGAHRVAWMLANGAIPNGLLVRHKCDNPICVRADHLELGTGADNMRDMIERGRAPWNKKNNQQ